MNRPAFCAAKQSKMKTQVSPPGALVRKGRFCLLLPSGNSLTSFFPWDKMKIEIFTRGDLLNESQKNHFDCCRGNAVLLKGGREALKTNQALCASVRTALRKANLPMDACQLLETREDVSAMLKEDNLIDLEELILQTIEEDKRFTHNLSWTQIWSHKPGSETKMNADVTDLKTMIHARRVKNPKLHAFDVGDIDSTLYDYIRRYYALGRLE